MNEEDRVAWTVETRIKGRQIYGSLVLYMDQIELTEEAITKALDFELAAARESMLKTAFFLISEGRNKG